MRVLLEVDGSACSSVRVCSVAESVARHAPCSVDIVRMPLAAADRVALQSRDAAHR